MSVSQKSQDMRMSPRSVDSSQLSNFETAMEYLHYTFVKGNQEDVARVNNFMRENE